MTDAQAAKRQAADGAYASGIEMLDRGESPEAVEQKLVEMGLSAESAKGIVASYSSATEQVRAADGKSEMLQGALACGGGLVVLLVASGSIIGWLGTILGAIQLFRGWRMSLRSRP